MRSTSESSEEFNGSTSTVAAAGNESATAWPEATPQSRTRVTTASDAVNRISGRFVTRSGRSGVKKKIMGDVWRFPFGRVSDDASPPEYLATKLFMPVAVVKVEPGWEVQLCDSRCGLIFTIYFLSRVQA